MTWLLVLREWGVFGVGTAVAEMVLLDEDVASLPCFDSSAKKHWLILLAIFTSLKV